MENSSKRVIIKRNSSIEYQNKCAIDESKFKLNYRNLLNSAQYEAVTSIKGAYLIIAGAGSGKTRTLVHRVAYLIEAGYPPESILLLTFTRKAANEMMNRASLLLDDRCSKIKGGTFHSFANLILRKYAKAANLDPSFTIIDQSDSEDVINLLRSQFLGAKKDKRFPNKQTLLKFFSLSVNTGRTIEELVIEDYPHFEQDIESIITLSRFYTNYKKKNNLVDYDDLLIYLRDLLNSNSPVAEYILNSINFVMVDEYQDTNKLQAEVVLALTKKKQDIMVVGDDSQSIYSFRGANFRNIMDFPKLYANVTVIMLEENYRSTPEILDFANHIIECSIEKYPKVLYTKRKSGQLPVIGKAGYDNVQAAFIVSKVLELRESGIPLSEMAVLFRSSFFSFKLEIELTKANIPFIKFGGMKFVEAAHIKDIIAFLRILLNEKDFVSWLRILQLHSKVGPKTAQKVIDLLDVGEISYKKPPDLLPGIIKEKFYELFNLLFIAYRKNSAPQETTQLIIDYYYPIFHEKYDDFNKRKKDLDTLISITENYRSLESFISDMAIEPPINSAIELEPESKENEFLTLSTIHSAKGLEWDSVFIIHALDGYFPSSRSVGKIEDLEEERRLMYVAVTRAKNELYITFPMNIFDRENGTVLSLPSRFISDIPKHLAEDWTLETEREIDNYDDDYYF